jgi:4-hydroxy-4-methyl-2-oxoglutarate aldolase
MATHAELERIRPRLFGLISEDRIAAVDIPRPSAEALAGYAEITDLTSSVSDVLDELGVGGGASARHLVPLSTGQRVIGPAVTIRYVPEGGSPGAIASRGEPGRLADRDMYAVGDPGDIAVFDCGGFSGASVMGGLSAAWARRLQIAGCIVDGAIRDVASIRDAGVPVWSRGVTPVSGKHRVRAVEINGTVTVAGISVTPGDLSVADDTGVCVIPADHIEAVKQAALEAEAAERKLTDAIAAGASPADVAAILRPEKW